MQPGCSSLRHSHGWQGPSPPLGPFAFSRTHGVLPPLVPAPVPSLTLASAASGTLSPTFHHPLPLLNGILKIQVELFNTKLWSPNSAELRAFHPLCHRFGVICLHDLPRLLLPALFRLPLNIPIPDSHGCPSHFTERKREREQNRNILPPTPLAAYTRLCNFPCGVASFRSAPSRRD